MSSMFTFPLSDEFVLQKLKKEHVDDGAYLLRWSVLDYRRIILAVLSRAEVWTCTFFVEKHKVGLKDFSLHENLTCAMYTFHDLRVVRSKMGSPCRQCVES